MISPELLIRLYQRTQWVIDKQTDGLTHSDSLLQMPFRGNCLNWVLGHILTSRDKVLELLERTTVLSEHEISLYQRESEPITDGISALPLEKLLTVLEESQEQIEAALKEVSSDRLEAHVDEESERTVRDRIEFLHWHETYHVGQLEILRQLAGKDDSII